jgi:DNA-directed RNA polymerase subunit RPC12/RpoP
MNNKLVYLCDSCGAEVVFKKNDNIKECSYCGNFIAIIDEKIDIHGDGNVTND